MEQTKVDNAGREAEGYVIPMGPFNLVCIKTENGMIGCGAFDVAALDRFNYPAARISGVSTVDDLLSGTIKEANRHASDLGIEAGMSGKEALALL